MKRKEDTFTAHQDNTALPELDLDEMGSVTGGCANCGCSNGTNGGANQLAAAMPLLANQNGLRR
jgi:hypothetical protein